jgi:hypothetical protein
MKPRTTPLDERRPRWSLAWWFLAATLLATTGCQKDEAGAEGQGGAAAVAPGCSGAVLFGRPNDKTGLTAEQCSPRCTCGGAAWEQPEYTDADIAELQSWKLLDPPGQLASDPYAASAPPAPGADAVCGMLPVDRAAKSYKLVDYGSADEALAAGARVTHAGVCGLCSPLGDLVAYMKNNDLTGPVRQCGLDHSSGPPEAHIACLEALGFDGPCAQIWYFNTLHTRQECIGPCIAALKEPYHLEDGTLNECLLCDEDKSGPVFKAIAGRTRRNTGLANSMCRPCSEVTPLVHRY